MESSQALCSSQALW